MGGTSLAFRRRSATRLFTERVFVGDAIDIGCGDDPIRVCAEFPQLRRVAEWDLVNGDARLMDGVADESFDLVYSSHCLEHLHEPIAAVERWWSLVKPGGHLVVVVPDEVLYEKGLWPSRFNPDHKWAFTTYRSRTEWSSRQRPVLHMAAVAVQPGARVLALTLLDDGWLPNSVHDQTADASCECGIELVMRKERS